MLSNGRGNRLQLKSGELSEEIAAASSVVSIFTINHYRTAPTNALNLLVANLSSR